ncbi:MAG TPA: hypothetical protein QGF05_08085 [Dehalococcoidia bacterium]|nr:hypothetical protein [Dehalococcoidia bacterium]
MAHIRIINEDEATGQLVEDYQFLSDSYSHAAQTRVPAPQVYRTSSLIPEYFHFGAVQNRVLTNNGAHDRDFGPLPTIMVNFATSMFSACFY